MLYFAVLMVVAALVFYTVSVWSYVIKRKLYSLTIALFGIGFVCDVAGTIAMTSLRNGRSMSAHGVIGWCAMMLMLALLIIFSVAYPERGTTEHWVRKFAFSAWAIWVISFLSALW